MSFLFLLLFGLIAAQARDELRQGLTFHASFDDAYVAELSADAPDCVVRVGRTLQPATDGPDLARVPDGRFRGRPPLRPQKLRPPRVRGVEGPRLLDARLVGNGIGLAPHRP